MIKYVHPESREKEGLRSMHPADFCAKLVQKSKGKGQAPNGLVHVYASFVALAKIAEQNTALGCFGLERERERFATSCRVTFIRTSNFHCFEVMLPCPFQVKVWLATE